MLTEGRDGNVVVQGQYTNKMIEVLRKYNDTRVKNLLLSLPFLTIDDYLHKLRGVSCAMRTLGTGGLLYLAAAVSDFFLPVR